VGGGGELICRQCPLGLGANTFTLLSMQTFCSVMLVKAWKKHLIFENFLRRQYPSVHHFDQYIEQINFANVHVYSTEVNKSKPFLLN
jgi:hypothetical protein